jgi:hypothetical protein
MSGCETFSHQQLHQLLDEVLGPGLRAKRIASLADATLGVMHAASLAVCTIGHGLAMARGLTRYGVADRIEARWYQTCRPISSPTLVGHARFGNSGKLSGQAPIPARRSSTSPGITAFFCVAPPRPRRSYISPPIPGLMVPSDVTSVSMANEMKSKPDTSSAGSDLASRPSAPASITGAKIWILSGWA